MSKKTPTLVEFTATKHAESYATKGHGIADVLDIKAIEKEYKELYPKEEEKVEAPKAVEESKEVAKEVKKK